ncbi:MAG: 50S ribosomal protein L18 [archaeon]|nr:50S ribosomal protein L18 [archaeon]
MGKGPKYRVGMRRRREGKTNYQRRLKMVLSGKLRVVIRASNNSTIVQVAETNIIGDKILVASNSNQLKKLYNWNYNSGNISSAYLAGFLCGMKAKKAGIKNDSVILDLGIYVHRNRVLAAFQGFLDAGIQVPCNKEKFFGKSGLDKRINGEHIKNYAEKLIKEDKEKYERVFSSYIKNNIDPAKITNEFEKIKKVIAKV